MNTTLYRHFDSNDNLLYVGISLNEFNRFKQHMVNSDWSTDAAYTRYERFNTREEALDAEKQAIINEKPLYNTIHNNTVKKVISRMDRIHELLRKYSWYLDYAYGRKMENWAHEYDSIKKLLSDDEWIQYTTERGLSIHHYGWDCIN